MVGDDAAPVLGEVRTPGGRKSFQFGRVDVSRSVLEYIRDVGSLYPTS